MSFFSILLSGLIAWGALVPSSGGAAIGYLEHKVLHALTGAASGALLNEDNRRAGALWGAIGAGGSEMLMEAVYDPRARSRAIIQDMADDLREGRIQLSGGNAFVPQGGTSLALLDGNPMQEMRQIFADRLRRDVERTRDVMRTGMAFGSLMAGARAHEINILDQTAYRATQENFFAQVIGAGLVLWEGVRIVGEAVDVYRQEGLGAALAHAGTETAKEVALAVTGIKAVKITGKVLSKVGRWGMKTQAFSWVCEKAAVHTPEAAKALWGQVGGVFAEGAQAFGRLDRRLDQWALGQFRNLGFTVPKSVQTPMLCLPAPQRRNMVTWPRPEVLPPLPIEVARTLDSISHVNVDVSRWTVIPKVKNQLVKPDFVKHFGYLSEEQLVRLSHNPCAGIFSDRKTGHINIIQMINNKYMRITSPKDEFKIISTGFIQEDDYVKYTIPRGRLLQLNFNPLKEE